MPFQSEHEMKFADRGFTRSDTGFSITFPNGHGLSVQWSPSHMCSLYSSDFHGVHAHHTPEHSVTAECCEISPHGLGKVHGHCSPETVLKLLRRAERKQTPAERAMARQARIESLQRPHGWQNTPEFEPKEKP